MHFTGKKTETIALFFYISFFICSLVWFLFLFNSSVDVVFSAEFNEAIQSKHLKCGRISGLLVEFKLYAWIIIDSISIIKCSYKKIWCSSVYDIRNKLYGESLSSAICDS